MSCRRVFANNNSVSFNDYNRCIKGQQIYKDISQRGPNYRDKDYYLVNNEITKFLDYDTFLNLTKTFYKYNGPYENSYYAPFSIQDGKKSFLSYRQLLSHIKDCDYCCRCKNINEICECKEAKNYLYPYGNFPEEKSIFKFPTRLNVDCGREYECSGDYRPTPKKLVPICPDSCEKPCCRSPCDVEPPLRKGCYNKCYRPNIPPRFEEPNCCYKGPPPCINNVYPSQNQFKFYKSDCYGDINDCDKEKRINAFAVYPQLDRFACYNNERCGPVIKPYPCNPCRNTCGEGHCGNTRPLFQKSGGPPPPYGKCCR